MSITAENIQHALAGIIDPNTGKSFVATKSIKNIQINGADVSLTIELGYPAKSQQASF